jgi:hypothetical protein
VLLAGERAVSPARAELITGFAALGVGPGETNNLFVGLTSSDTPGVSISKITFNTSAEGVVLQGGTGGGTINNGVGSFTFFPSTFPTSTFGLNTTGFFAGSSIFDSNLNLTLSGSIASPANLVGTSVTVNFSDGSMASTTLTTMISGSNSLGSYVDVEGIFTLSSTTPPSATPEPSTLVMASTGMLIGLGCLWRRHKRAVA